MRHGEQSFATHTAVLGSQLLKDKEAVVLVRKYLSATNGTRCRRHISPPFRSDGGPVS